MRSCAGQTPFPTDPVNVAGKRRMPVESKVGAILRGAHLRDYSIIVASQIIVGTLAASQRIVGTRFVPHTAVPLVPLTRQNINTATSMMNRRHCHY